MKKRILGCIALLCMLVTLAFAGCGGGTGDATIPLDVDFNNKPELSIMLQATGRGDGELDTSLPAQIIEKHTGYKVSYSQLPATEITMAVQLAFMNRSPYHAIKVTKEQFNLLLAQDALLDIRPALETYGTYLLENINQANWNVVTYNGGIYGIPEGGSFTKGQYNVVDCMIFREDLLYEEGLDIPETLDEFTAVLRHFKQKYGASYYPLTIPAQMDGTELAALVPSIAVAFDIYQYWSKVGDEYVYYLDHPNYKAYMEYMIGLYNEGLIDLDVMTQDKTGAISKFGSGDAVCIVTTTEEIPAILSMLRSNGEIGQNEQNLAVVGGLLDSNGEVHTYHRGGFAYVTVIPRYMNEEAAYTVDWLTRKLYDDCYLELNLGEEGVNYVVNPDGTYSVTNSLSELSMSSYFTTGQINSAERSQVWFAKIRNQEYYPYFMELNEFADEQGTYNPILFSNHLETYDGNRNVLDTYAREQAMIMIFEDRSVARYEEVLARWKADGGESASQEVTDWCRDNFDGKVKVEDRYD